MTDENTEQGAELVECSLAVRALGSWDPQAAVLHLGLISSWGFVVKIPVCWNIEGPGQVCLHVWHSRM